MGDEEKLAQKICVQEQKLDEITVWYEKLKALLQQKQQSRTRRENTCTTLDTITSPNSGTRHCRRDETKNVLEYIHGGENAALLGAWDFVSANAPK